MALPGSSSPPPARELLLTSALLSAYIGLAASLGSYVTPERVAEAAAGMDRSRERLKGIESRLQFYLQAGGLTGTLVFASIGVLAGEKSLLNGDTQTVALIAVIVASIASLVAGVHALAGVMRTFDQISPFALRVPVGSALIRGLATTAPSVPALPH